MPAKFLRCCAIILMAAITSCNNAPEKPTEAKGPDYTLLRMQADSIARTLPCKLAFALINIETGDTFSYNGDAHMPLQSTVKFPLALMILQKIDSGTLTLDQKIHVTKDQLVPNTHSPMRDSLHGNAGDLSIHDMLNYMLAMSDNISCQIFTRLMGGPEQIVSFAKAQGVKEIALTSVQGEPTLNFNNPHDNWSRPIDMANLLMKFYKGAVLSKTGTDTLRNIMERTTGGLGRIKGLLPAGTIVAHKTGTSGTDNGITAAVNDIGIITLPNGNHLVLAVYVSDITGDMATGETIIAKTAKAVYDVVVRE